MKKTLHHSRLETEATTDFSASISEIVRSDYRTADVFKMHGINYCCGGTVTVVEACAARGLDYNKFRKELEMATRNIHLSNNLQFNQWKIDFLIDYIINVHHAYLKQTLPVMETTLLLFVEGHQKKYAEMEVVLRTFHELSDVLEAHNRHEEEIIFPYIKQIESMYTRKESYGNLFVRTLRKPLDNLEREHHLISELLNQMQTATNNYTPPHNACTNHQVIFRKLSEFHDDLVQHKHLENNILYPRVMEMERELLQL